MPNPNLPTWVYLAGGGVVAGLALYVAFRGTAGVVQDMVGGVASAAGSVIEGGIVGLGNVVGVPETNRSQCELDKAAGDTMAASFSCPAKDFLSYLFN